MISLVDFVLLVIAVAIFLWGFERYRTRFSKVDLLVGVGLSSGLLLLAIAPGIFDILGNALEIDQRFIVVSLLANFVLLLLILYLITTLRDTRANINKLTRNLTVQDAPRTDGGLDTVFVIIPAYNEQETIRSVVESLPAQIRGYTVQTVVVSDGSADQTAERAQYDGAIVVEHPVNQGQGGALKTGFEVAQQNGADIIVTMDADGQHPVTELEKLVSPIMDDTADFVMGSRYKGANNSGNSAVRETGIRFFTGLINILTKSNITDCTNGYRAIRGSKIGELTLTEERFSAPELIVEAKKNNLQIQEIPITIRERGAGESKKPQLGYAIGLARTVLVTWLR